MKKLLKNLLFGAMVMMVMAILTGCQTLPWLDSTTENTVTTVNGGVDPEVIEASEGLEYVLLSDDTYSVVGIGTCTDTDIVIPSNYNGKAVKSIDSNAFCDC